MPPMICVHGHFYQPARENPWLGTIEPQPSAFPWHDWNHRIADECYAPNAAARILGADGAVRTIMSNYARMSFNFGPTLLSWMERERPRLYDAVLEADRMAAARFSGHGGAFAQVFNHMIMPLATRRDKYTQILWGMEDFRHRFGRDPEGMWLAEAAVDLETLDIMAENGILFTLLAPRQAAFFRSPSSPEWISAAGERIDHTRPYRCVLPSGRSMTVFFYDNGLSHGVAFGELLSDGKRMVEALLSAARGAAPGGLVSLSVDGETFGHHHKYGDMALAYCLEAIEKRKDVRLTVYGEYLEKNPPVDEVRLVENSSWSCAHGVERWRSDCGCAPQDHPVWNQRWRAPLRRAYDSLRDRLDPLFARAMGEFFPDPWGTRDRYVRVLLRGGAREFLASEAKRPMTREEEVRALSLLEMERNLMVMYTSCGWFFDDLARIETIQTMAYAGRAVELAEGLFPGEDILEPFLALLREARSNREEAGDGAQIFRASVPPMRADLGRCAANYAAAVLFTREGEPLCCAPSSRSWRVLCSSLERGGEGSSRYVLGRVAVQSLSTLREEEFFVAAVYRRGGDFLCQVMPPLPEGREEEWRAEAKAALCEARPDDLGGRGCTFGDLFREVQRRILEGLLEEGAREAIPSLEKGVRDYTGLHGLQRPPRDGHPDRFRTMAAVVLTEEILLALEEDAFDASAVDRLAEDALRWNVPLDGDRIRGRATRLAESLFARLEGRPGDEKLLRQALDLLTVRKKRGWAMDLWRCQNTLARILEGARRRGEPLPQGYGAAASLLSLSPSVYLPDWSCGRGEGERLSPSGTERV